jgi:putative flippase GtrA
LSSLPDGVVGEVIFVDDSDDDTPETINRVADGCGFPVRVLHRELSERVDGLSGAVVSGFRIADGGWLCVMDADLQHPPEMVAAIYAKAARSDAQIVCATRYAEGGQRKGLGVFRKLVSHGSTLTARILFPRRLSAISDPMSGFFMVRRDAIDLERIRGRGFKILLEILCRHPELRHVEVPYRFESRFSGESKASLGEGLSYVEHLLRLRFRSVASWPSVLRAACGFAAVGAVGIVFNEVLLWLLVAGTGTGYLFAAVIATQATIAFNYVLLERWVFRDENRGLLLRRFTLYWATSTILLVVGLPVLAVLVSGVGVDYVLANLVVIGLQFVLRFLISDRLIWRRSRVAADVPGEIPVETASGEIAA